MREIKLLFSSLQALLVLTYSVGRVAFEVVCKWVGSAGWSIERIVGGMVSDSNFVRSCGLLELGGWFGLSRLSSKNLFPINDYSLAYKQIWNPSPCFALAFCLDCVVLFKDN